MPGPACSAIDVPSGVRALIDLNGKRARTTEPVVYPLFQRVGALFEAVFTSRFSAPKHSPHLVHIMPGAMHRPIGIMSELSALALPRAGLLWLRRGCPEYPLLALEVIDLSNRRICLCNDDAGDLEAVQGGQQFGERSQHGL